MDRPAVPPQETNRAPPSELDLSGGQPDAAAAAPEPINSPLTPNDDANVDYDALYEPAAADDEEMDMKNHGSVITHLLSQATLVSLS